MGKEGIDFRARESVCRHQPTNLPTNQSNQYVPKMAIEGEGCMAKGKSWSKKSR